MVDEDEETRRERVRHLAREWYARNKERLRAIKLERCHEYRQKCRGRPPRTETHPHKVLVFNIETGDLRTYDPSPPLPLPPKQLVVHQALSNSKSETSHKIEAGNFFVSFE
jgi:hypothetical protein